MFVTSFRVSKQMTIGRLQFMIQNYWGIVSEFQSYSLFDDNGDVIENKNMFVLNFLEN